MVQVDRSPTLSAHDSEKEKGLRGVDTAFAVDEDESEHGVRDEDVTRVMVKRYGAFGRVLAKLFENGVESRGVERVPEDMRETANLWNNLLMWWSVNMVLSTLPVGFLSKSIFNLPFRHALASILCFSAVGAVLTAYIACLGPKTGLRTMIITRFSSGYAGCTIYSILNILTQLGFSVTGVILGGQTLAAVNPGTLPLTAGIVIVGVCSIIPCFIGYHMIHRFERYAWIVLLVLMFFLWGLGAHAGFDFKQAGFPEDTGKALSSDILSYGGILFASVTGWAPVAADYNCRLPVDTPSRTVFIQTFFGLFLPITFVEILGAALMTITDPAYVDAFDGGDTGALLAKVLSPWKGGGKFILVLLALSMTSNNIVNTYSAGLSIQSLGRPFAMVPRIFWTLLAFVAYTVAGVAGREHFSAILSNFLAILGYWTAWFIVILLEEHYIFRRPGSKLGGYNFEDWDSPSRLPLGIAGILAAGFGLAGAVTGMAEVWYIGPIGKLAGAEFGADLGFELAFAFSAITYPPLRWLEIKYFGR